MFHSWASLLVTVPDFVLLEISEFKRIHILHIQYRPSNNTTSYAFNLTLSYWSNSKNTYASLRRWYCSAHINFVDDDLWLRIGPVPIKQINHIFKCLIRLKLITPNWRAYIKKNKTTVYLFPFPLAKLTVQRLL